MKGREASSSNGTLPYHRNIEDELGQKQDGAHLDVADDDVGEDLAEHDFDGMDRGGEEDLHGAAFAFTGDGERRNDDHGHGQHHSHQTGDDIVAGNRFRVEARLDAHFQRIVAGEQGGERAAQFAADGALDDNPEGSNGVAGCGRVGSVGFEKEGGALAAQELALEAGGDGEDELGAAIFQEFCGSGFTLDAADECGSSCSAPSPPPPPARPDRDRHCAALSAAGADRC